MSSSEDMLITPDMTTIPDDRNLSLGINDISVQYNLISEFSLEDYVPEKITTQYEVARNLYLYAFYCYRFYMVAQHQTLTVLEMAIKDRFGEKEIKRYGKMIQKGRGLSACLHYIIDNEYIANSDFPAWHKRPQLQAEQDYIIARIEEMEAKVIEEIEVDYSKAEITTCPEDFDFLATLIRRVPQLRNTHAHGSKILYNHVLTTFETVSVIINKIFKPE